jgi:hypothetical protein
MGNGEEGKEEDLRFYFESDEVAPRTSDNRPRRFDFTHFQISVIYRDINFIYKHRKNRKRDKSEGFTKIHD